MKPLLIGPAPGARATDGSPAFGPGPGSGARLARLLDLNDVQAYFDTLNLLPLYPGRTSSGADAFPLAEARSRALSVDLSERPFTLLVGRNVARAFNMPWLPYLRWMRYWYPGIVGFGWVAVLPHPSGLNRWWNSAENQEAASDFVRSALWRNALLLSASVT